MKTKNIKILLASSLILFLATSCEKENENEKPTYTPGRITKIGPAAEVLKYYNNYTYEDNIIVEEFINELDGSNYKTEYHFDDQERITQIISKSGSVTSFTYAKKTIYRDNPGSDSIIYLINSSDEIYTALTYNDEKELKDSTYYVWNNENLMELKGFSTIKTFNGADSMILSCNWVYEYDDGTNPLNISNVPIVSYPTYTPYSSKNNCTKITDNSPYKEGKYLEFKYEYFSEEKLPYIRRIYEYPSGAGIFEDKFEYEKK